MGRLLIETGEIYFRKRGLNRLEVTSGPAHGSAHGFYERLGFSNEGVRFAKPLA